MTKGEFQKHSFLAAKERSHRIRGAGEGGFLILRKKGEDARRDSINQRVVEHYHTAQCAPLIGRLTGCTLRGLTFSPFSCTNDARNRATRKPGIRSDYLPNARGTTQMNFDCCYTLAARYLEGVMSLSTI